MRPRSVRASRDAGPCTVTWTSPIGAPDGSDTTMASVALPPPERRCACTSGPTNRRMAAATTNGVIRIVDLLNESGSDVKSEHAPLRSVCLAPCPLHRNALRGEHLVLQRKHRGRRLIDMTDERNRSGEDGLQPRFVLNARRRILVLDDEVRVGDVEREQLPRGELVIEPVDGPILQIRERIVLRRPRQLVLGKDRLLLPRVQLIRRIRGRLVAGPIAALDRLAAVAPRADALGVDDLALHVEAADQEVVAGVLQVLEDRSSVLSHEDGVGRIVVDAEVVPEAVLLADAMQRDPRAG